MLSGGGRGNPTVLPGYGLTVSRLVAKVQIGVKHPICQPSKQANKPNWENQFVFLALLSFHLKQRCRSNHLEHEKAICNGEAAQILTTDPQKFCYQSPLANDRRVGIEKSLLWLPPPINSSLKSQVVQLRFNKHYEMASYSAKQLFPSVLLAIMQKQDKEINI